MTIDDDMKTMTEFVLMYAKCEAIVDAWVNVARIVYKKQPSTHALNNDNIDPSRRSVNEKI